MSICKEKPPSLPPLHAIGIEPLITHPYIQYTAVWVVTAHLLHLAARMSSVDQPWLFI